MNKQSQNPWARWKVLLFIPLTVLLVQCFARPEIDRELEQISVLESTEIFQQNTEWSENRFLEELRKNLPIDVSHNLGYEETWIEVANKYQLLNQGNLNISEGISVMINARGDLMGADHNGTNRITIDDVPSLLENSLTVNGETGRIIRWTLIQSDVNAPDNDFQNLLNVVGEVYVSKRNEMTQQYYQTDYYSLNSENKSVIDDVVPMLVMIVERGPYTNSRIISTPSN